MAHTTLAPAAAMRTAYPASDARPAHDLPRFTRIDAQGACVLQLKQGAAYAADTAADGLTRYVKDDCLFLRAERPVAPGEAPPVVVVTLPVLEALAVAGSVSARAQTTFACRTLELRLAGAGVVALYVTAEAVDVHNEGAGNVALAGRTKWLQITSTGSGDVRADALQARFVEACMEGSGKCFVFATDAVEALITGSGDLLYKGYPEITIATDGAGALVNNN